MGKQLSELIDKLGYPVRSDYDYVDEKEPSQGEIGTSVFQRRLYGYHPAQ